MILDITHRKILDDIPQEIKYMGNINLILYGTSTVKLGYLIFGYPVAGPENYLLFRRVSKDSQDDKRVIFLGEYHFLKDVVYRLKEDLFNTAANGGGENG